MAEVIQFSGVSLYINNRRFLDQVDLSIREGETLVISGPPGCGKSLVIRLIMGLPGVPRGEEVAIEGEVRVNGASLADLSATEMQQLRMQMGSVLRSGGLIDNMDVRQNITLPLNYHFRDTVGAEAIGERCRVLLESMGMGHLDQPGRRPVSLNREEKVYVALARALINQPRLILLDDLTVGLSPAAADRMVQNMLGSPRFTDAIHLHGGEVDPPATRVITASNLSFYLDAADRFAILDEQRLRVIGSRQQVIDSDDDCVQGLLYATDFAHE